MNIKWIHNQTNVQKYIMLQIKICFVSYMQVFSLCDVVVQGCLIEYKLICITIKCIQTLGKSATASYNHITDRNALVNMV